MANHTDFGADFGPILQVEIITAAFMYSVVFGSLPYVGPGYETARDDIRQFYPRLNVTQRFLNTYPWFPTCADWATESENAWAKFYYQTAAERTADTVTAFILPGCNIIEIDGVAKLATQLDKVMITSGTNTVDFPNPELWPSWISTTALAKNSYRQVVQAIIDLYNWENVAFVSDLDVNPFYHEFPEEYLARRSDKSTVQISMFYYKSQAANVDYTGLLRNISQVSRVVFVFGLQTSLHRLLVPLLSMSLFQTSLFKLNKCHNEYSVAIVNCISAESDKPAAYIALAPSRSPAFGNYTWKDDNAAMGEVAKEAYKSLFLIEPATIATDDKASLIALWKNRSAKYFNYTYRPDETMTDHPFTAYASMLIFAEALEEMRQTASGKSILSGTEIAGHLKNRTFQLRTGDVRIDQFGDHSQTMILTQTDVVTGSVTSVLVYDGSRLRPTGTVVWSGNWPLPDRPQCGFMGDDLSCRVQGQMRTIVVSLAVAIAAVCVALLVVILVRIRMESARPWWLLPSESILLRRSGVDISIWSSREHPPGQRIRFPLEAISNSKELGHSLV